MPLYENTTVSLLAPINFNDHYRRGSEKALAECPPPPLLLFIQCLILMYVLTVLKLRQQSCLDLFSIWQTFLHNQLIYA